VKLARQEGVEVDRKKEADAEAKTVCLTRVVLSKYRRVTVCAQVGFERSATRDDVRLTLSLETLEEIRDAGSVTRVNSNSHVSKDQAAEILDKRPSQLDAKTGERAAPYALQTSVCNDGSRDHGVLTSSSMAEGGLKRKGFRCRPQIIWMLLLLAAACCLLLLLLCGLNLRSVLTLRVMHRVFLSDRSKGTGEDKMRAPFY
jgi:hypothetical protein